MNEFFNIARITSIYGLDGFLKIQLLNNIKTELDLLKEVYIDFFSMKKKFIVEEIKKTDRSFIIKFERFSDERELQVLLGRDIYISKADLSVLGPNSIRQFQLIESEVWRDNKLLGKIKEVMNMPANDVLVIVSDTGNELLIPLVSEYIQKSDPENKILILKPGTGHYEDDEN